jgi:hypothetical protein
MNLSFACPNCRTKVRRDFTPDTHMLDCPHCTQQIAVPRGAIGEGAVHRCLVCPSRDLYVRKDIPQRLGVSVVGVGILASSIAWGYHQVYWTFGILFATALVDLVLFFLVGNSLMCYRCHAVYRGVDRMDAHGPFNLDTHERYRQLAARLSPSSASPPQRPL